jgi:hypothetical protein
MICIRLHHTTRGNPSFYLFLAFLMSFLARAGGLDWDNFEKVMIHYLVKQSRKESNEFGHKNVIGLADFDTP